MFVLGKIKRFSRWISMQNIICQGNENSIVKSKAFNYR